MISLWKRQWFLQYYDRVQEHCKHGTTPWSQTSPSRIPRLLVWGCHAVPSSPASTFAPGSRCCPSASACPASTSLAWPGTRETRGALACRAQISDGRGAGADPWHAPDPCNAAWRPCQRTGAAVWDRSGRPTMRSSGMPQWNVCDGTVPVKVITKNICICICPPYLPRHAMRISVRIWWSLVATLLTS